MPAPDALITKYQTLGYDYNKAIQLAALEFDQTQQAKIDSAAANQSFVDALTSKLGGLLTSQAEANQAAIRSVNANSGGSSVTAGGTPSEFASQFSVPSSAAVQASPVGQSPVSANVLLVILAGLVALLLFRKKL